MDGRVKVVPKTPTPISQTPKQTPTPRSQTPKTKTPLSPIDSFLQDIGKSVDDIFSTASKTSFGSESLSKTEDKTTLSIPDNIITTNTTTYKPATTTLPFQPHNQTYVQSTPLRTMGREYTDAEINTYITKDYFKVPEGLWKNIPIGSHVRFFKKAAVCGSKSKGARFRPGGFVKSHVVNDEQDHILILETIYRGKPTTANYITFPMALKDLDEIWKKPTRESYIEYVVLNDEIRKVNNNLISARNDINIKNKEIESLKNRVNQMEKILKIVANKVNK